MRRLDEGEIGRDHEEVVVVEEFVEATEADECGVGAAAVVALLDEGDVDRGRPRRLVARPANPRRRW